MQSSRSTCSRPVGLWPCVQMMPVDFPPISGCVKFNAIMRQLTNLRVYNGGIRHRHGVVGMDHRAILEDGMRIVGHGFFPSAEQHGRRIADEIERQKIAATKYARLVRPHDGITNAAAERTAGADAILDDHRETLAALVGQIPEQAGIAAGRVQIAENPAVANDRGEGLAGFVAGGPVLVGRADRSPPIPAFESLLGIAGIDQHPSLAAGTEAAVKIADQDVVRARSAGMGRGQIGLDVSVGPDDDSMSALVVRYGRKSGLNRVKCLLPTAAVGVVARLGDKDGYPFTT